ncbi:hypothetical protein ACFQQB_18655 [Nonomuraea rubra]|uniref:hypothetical protein n=1 Tax=Nonomuraea rubra TaxID=46180 RepID=UPI00362211EA
MIVLPCRSVELSRFHRQACWHQAFSATLLWQGSPASLPNTGAVQAERVSGLPELQPGSRFRPNTYWVPSVPVTRQCSPSSSPLAAPVSCSILVPSSRLSRQPLAPLTSSTAEPFRTRVALSWSQHRSPVFLPSAVHALYRRSM